MVNSYLTDKFESQTFGGIYEVLILLSLGVLTSTTAFAMTSAEKAFRVYERLACDHHRNKIYQKW